MAGNLVELVNRLDWLKLAGLVDWFYRLSWFLLSRYAIRPLILRPTEVRSGLPPFEVGCAVEA